MRLAMLQRLFARHANKDLRQAGAGELEEPRSLTQVEDLPRDPLGGHAIAQKGLSVGAPVLPAVDFGHLISRTGPRDDQRVRLVALLHLRHRAVEDRLAVIDHQYAMTQLLDARQPVRREDDGHALGLEATHQFLKPPDVHGV